MIGGQIGGHPTTIVPMQKLASLICVLSVLMAWYLLIEVPGVFYVKPEPNGKFKIVVVG